MRLEFSLTSRRGTRRVLVAQAAPSATLRQVIADRVADGDTVYAGSRPVELDRPLGDAGVRSGADLSVGHPGEERPWPLHGPALAVLGGAAAGTVVPLPAGTAVVVGRGAPAEVVLDEPTLSTRHTRVTAAPDGSAVVCDIGSTNGTFVSGSRLTGPRDERTVAPGERFCLGAAVVAVLPPTRPDGAVDVTPDGQARFNRVTRYRGPEPAVRVTLPAPPPDPPRSGMAAQLVGSAAMVVVGVVTALLLGNLLYAALGVVAPLVFLGTAMATQRGQRRDVGRRRRGYEAERARAEQELVRAAREEIDREWRTTCDPATAALAALGPTSVLWSVDGHDDTAMVVRVGTVDRPARITVQDAGRDAPAPLLSAAPVTVDLRAHPVVGIAGDQQRARAAARTVVHQLVTSRSPDDLLVVHLDASGGEGWEWLRWLPHVRGLDPDVHTVSPGPEALTARLDELTALVKQRQGLLEHGFGTQLLLPEVLVVVDGAGALRTRQALVGVLRDGPALGVRVLALDAVPARLPAEATARLVVDPQATGGPVGVLEVRGAETVEGITVDLLPGPVAERTARALAPLVPLGGVDGSGLPDSVRFVDLNRLDGAGPDDVLARWRAGTECQVLLGLDENGRPATVDLVRDGPHALVAGATGAGKSELLRTLLTGLALSAPPADLALMLVDFKGGGAFGKLADLPHVVGYADDQTIAGPLADRLLASLKAELEHRKRWFKKAGNVDGLAEYRSARRRDPGLPAIARLVVVVDEFAELKEQQPGFVDGLVGIARTGRSLGVHLVLATQRPTGVVTPQIRDNANLRICLRVLDAGVSSELVGSPVAASFPNRARGRVAVLAGEGQPVVLQTAYVSAPVRTVPRGEVPAPVVRTVRWPECGVRADAGPRAESGDAGPTDMLGLCALIGATARQEGLGPARKPWHPPLGERLDLDRLLAQVPAGVGDQVPFAVEDRPAEQRTVAFGLTLGGGNLAVVGGRGSGRSTALRTLAAALASRAGADDVHVHVVDQTTASVLRPLARLPHVGVVTTRPERHRTERLVARLDALLAERSRALVQHGAGTWAELRRSDPGAAPFVVVLVDGWDQLVQSGAEGLRLSLTRLAEEGPAAGIQLVVAGGKAVRQTRLFGTMESVLVLPFDQRDDMAEYAVPVKELPADIPPGRAHRPGSGDAVQIAVLPGDARTESQNAALGELAGRLDPPTRHLPLQLDDLPARIPWADAAALPAQGGPGVRAVLVGVGGDRLGGRVVDLDRLPGAFVVAGPAGSGRTAALVLIARQLAARGVPVMVAPGRDDDRERFPGVQLVDPLQPVELVDGAVVLVDDAGRLPDSAPLLLAAHEDRGVRLVLAGEPAGLSGYGKARVMAGASGLLFSPKSGEGPVIGCSITLDETFDGGPGRAYLGLRGAKEIVQVPWAG